MTKPLGTILPTAESLARGDVHAAWLAGQQHKLKLKPKTLRGKSKIREAIHRTLNWDLATWDVLQTRMALPMTAKSGPWHLVTPEAAVGTARDDISRWVHTADDQDFLVELTACNE
jgi:hypothetical protein